MRTRTRILATVSALSAGLILGGCSKGSGTDSASPGNAPAATAADVKGGSLTQLFGQTYTWPDGVKVTVAAAKIFTAYDKSLDEKPSAGALDYQVQIKITNGGHASLDLGNLSVITEGATSGGEAALVPLANAGPGLEGRVAPGVTVTKFDTESLETKFGRKIVVTVQRMSPDNSDAMAFPEFTGSITG